MKADYQVKNERMETMIKEWGKKLRQTLPGGVGFTLFLYDYGDGGNMFYLSTAERSDMIKALQEFVNKQQL